MVDFIAMTHKFISHTICVCVSYQQSAAGYVMKYDFSFLSDGWLLKQKKIKWRFIFQAFQALQIERIIF